MNQKVDFPANSLALSTDLLDQVQGFNSNELFWLSGYCSGLAEGRGREPQVKTTNSPSDQVSTDSSVELKTVVLYASQTGNSQTIAETLHKNLEQKGLPAKIASLDDFNHKELSKQQIILMVASTHGEGEPPDDAMDFHDFISSKRAPKLKNVQHAILALGDSSYEFYCQTGKDFDNAFSKLGSKPLVDRVDCDLDYDDTAVQWIDSVVLKIENLTASSSSNQPDSSTSLNQSLVSPGSINSTFSKTSPFAASILSNQKITGRGSNKRVHHIEISLENSDIEYLPGDSIGVWAKNNESLVDEILHLVNLKDEQQAAQNISFKGVEKQLRDALIENLEITLINKSFISEYAKLVAVKSTEKATQLSETINNDYAGYIETHQIIDVISLAPIALAAQQLVDLLKPIKPRIYSISSSLEANPEEAHITVALQESTNDITTRYGAASQFLIETLKEDDEVLVFIEHNKRFKLPDNNVPIIMIGPGTGIAPFRSFLQQRQEQSADGENWLFFGNPHFNTDFLYQLELQKFHKQGLLTHLNVAFSRDQKNKIYVQDRLLENARSIWQWLNERQAYLYVCGDMSRMAKDVDKTLLKIISEQGGKSIKQAEEFLKKLRKEDRYQRDVY